MNDTVAQAIVEVSDAVVMPRHRVLTSEQIFEKSPGDLVTVADREAEAELTKRLLDIDPKSQVVGEESVAANPEQLAIAASGGRVWVVDPIDGTSAFAGGRDRFAVMVALLDSGQIVKSWIWQPTTARMYVAELGGGAWVNDEPLKTASRSGDQQLRGDVRVRNFDEATRTDLKARSKQLPGVLVEQGGAVGYVYPELAEGDLDFALFGRQYPWDHAPGTLLLREAGGHALSLDATEYDPTCTTWGLLCTGPEVDWSHVRSEMFD